MKWFVFPAAAMLLVASQFGIQAQDAAKPGAKTDAKATDKPGDKTDKKSDDKKSDPDKKKSTNRLPNNYGKLNLSDAQRTKIYGVQDKYEDEIDALTEKLKALKAKRDHEIEAVLTAEQKKMLGDIEDKKSSDKPAGDEKKPAASDKK